MKIQIKNFGPIQEFNTTLNSDLMLIVGKNNIGKSYTISIIYLFLKILSTKRYRHSYYLHEIFFQKNNEFEKKYKDKINELEGKLNNRSQIEVNDIFSGYVADFLKNLIGGELKDSMNGTFGDLNLLERVGEDKPYFSICNEDMDFSFSIINGELTNYQIHFFNKLILKKVKRNLQDKINLDGSTTLYFNEKMYSDESALKDFLNIRTFRIAMAFLNSISKYISDVHYLPASRSGLYQSLTAFGQIIAELAKRRTFVSSKIELPSISEPLTDYFLKITEIKAKKNQDNEYFKIAEKIENDILHGKIDFDSKTKKIFYIKNNGNLRLDLSNTSSMVSEIGPIVAYLKHIIPMSDKKDNKAKQIIFIEEPEAHLHPEVQSKLMEIFVDLINDCNVKIILTSHSNFILNKLNNLILSERLNYHKVSGYQFIAPNDMGTIANKLEIDEFGIDDTNFVDIATELYEEKLNLFDQKMADGE